MSNLNDFNKSEAEKETVTEEMAAGAASFTEEAAFVEDDAFAEEDAMTSEQNRKEDFSDALEGEEESEDPQDADYEKLLSGAFGKTYVSAEARYQDLKESAKALMICGIGLLLLGFVGFLNLVSLPFNEMSLSLFILIGAGVLFYSVVTGRNANIARAQIAGEKKRRSEIIEWFEATYTASVIDDRIYAQETESEIGPELLDLKRIGMIQSFLQREFSMESEGFIDNICEELFEKLFQSSEN